MDCLSIAYFVRYASPDSSERIYLNLSFCGLGCAEFMALTHELRKPAEEQNVTLDVAAIQLSVQTLPLLKQMFHPSSCLTGLVADGDRIEDVNIVLKYIIEWLYHTLARETFIQLIPSNFTASSVYFLMLMVRGYPLNTLQLSLPWFDVASSCQCSVKL